MLLDWRMCGTFASQVCSSNPFISGPVVESQCLGMFLMIPITLAFQGVANTYDHIG